MKHCNLSNIDIDSDRKYCPLCFNEVDKTENKERSKTPEYLPRAKNEKIEKHSYFLTRIFLFLSIAIIGICIFINVLVKGKPWCLIVGLSILYIWVLTMHTILSKRSAFEKILFQLCNIIAILVASNHLAGGGEWLINYVVPSIALATTSILVLVSLIGKRHRSQFLLSFFIIYILFLVLSIVLVAAKFDTFKILNEINIMYTSLAILGTVLFGFRIIKNEGGKKLHI